MKHSILGVACAGVLVAVSGVVQAAAVSGQGTWETTLQGRDLDGNQSTAEAYYDTALNITWLADLNIMSWSLANSWLASMNPYGSGITGWRLPTVTDTGASGCDYTTSGGTDCGYNVDTATSEMAYMFYSTLGNLAYYSTSGVGNQPGWGISNTGPFSNIEIGDYWSVTEYAPSSYYAWIFNFYGGYQYYALKDEWYLVWAVHTGDVGVAVSSVPISAAAWLFGSGLLGLLGVNRTRRG